MAKLLSKLADMSMSLAVIASGLIVFAIMAAMLVEFLFGVKIYWPEFFTVTPPAVVIPHIGAP